MKNLIYFLITGLFLSPVFFACNDDEDPVPDVTVDEETLAVNKWIDEEMTKFYYWTDNMPDIDYKQESDSKTYFGKLLYSTDKYSYITDNYKSLLDDYNGEPVAMGFGPSFYRLSETSNKVFIMVNYVYPGSGAEAGGLKRGNVITKINGTELTTDNYYDLYSQPAYSVELGKFTVTGQDSYSLSNSGTTLNLTGSIPNPEPVIFTDVIEESEHKIGYLTYVSFISGTNDKYLTSMSDSLAKLKSAGITDLIVDLRYNPGGDISAAIHMASSLAPANVASPQNVLVNYTYNKELSNNSQYKKNDTFKSVTPNMDLDKVYFLTTNGTASASELVMVGLMPYMEVIMIGETTYGKPYGAYVLPDDNEKWAIVPIVMEYANTKDYTGFIDGITPTYEVLDYTYINAPSINDDLRYYYPLGDPSDEMIAKVLELITGVPPKAMQRLTTTKGTVVKPFKQIFPAGADNDPRRNLIIPAP